MALDPSFDTDTMAKALGIPSNKHMLHRHMYEEMKSIPLRWDLKPRHSHHMLVYLFPLLAIFFSYLITEIIYKSKFDTMKINE